MPRPPSCTLLARWGACCLERSPVGQGHWPGRFGNTGSESAFPVFMVVEVVMEVLIPFSWPLHRQGHFRGDMAYISHGGRAYLLALVSLTAASSAAPCGQGYHGPANLRMIFSAASSSSPSTSTGSPPPSLVTRVTPTSPMCRWLIRSAYGPPGDDRSPFHGSHQCPWRGNLFVIPVGHRAFLHPLHVSPSDGPAHL